MKFDIKDCSVIDRFYNEIEDRYKITHIPTGLSVTVNTFDLVKIPHDKVIDYIVNKLRKKVEEHE